MHSCGRPVVEQRIAPGLHATHAPSKHTLVLPLHAEPTHSPCAEQSSAVVVEPGLQRVASGLHTPTQAADSHTPGQVVSSTNVPS